jgi:hypothetical protein
MVPDKIAVLTSVLGDFDKLIDPKPQTVDFTFYRWTDDNFPPITGLTPRLQYRIPKTHGWEMLPGHDVYIWLDGTVSFQRDDCIEWYLRQLGDNDMAFFAHPYRHTIKEEVEHIEDHLNRGRPYIVSRYKNGLHRQQYERILEENPIYEDDRLYASTVFVYRNTPKVRFMLMDWWYTGSRYFTCDQVVLPYLLRKHGIKVKTLDEPIYKSGYISLVTHHK